MSFKGMLAAAAAAFMVAAGGAHATTFNFQFVDPTWSVRLGMGQFSTSADLTTPGVYTLDSLPDYALNLQFLDGTAFTGDGILTPTDGVALKVFGAGSTLAMEFTEAPGSADADHGPFGGAVDLGTPSGSNLLSFEPSFAGGNNEYIEIAPDGGGFAFGYYTAFVAGVPEPATWGLMILGLAAVGAAMRRRAPLAVA